METVYILCSASLKSQEADKYTCITRFWKWNDDEFMDRWKKDKSIIKKW